MRILTYMDSYHYYGLWDSSMMVMKNDELICLHNICKNTDIGNQCSTRDALTIYVVNAEKISLDDICYFECDRKFNTDNLMERKIIKEIIEIKYFSKNFEKHIPAIMKKYKNVDYDVKLTFIYSPVNEKEFFSIENNLTCYEDCGWVCSDEIDKIINFLKAA